MITPLTLTVSIEPVTDLTDAARSMCWVAERLGVNVVSAFNGVRLRATPDTSATTVAEQYYTACRDRAKQDEVKLSGDEHEKRVEHVPDPSPMKIGKYGVRLEQGPPLELICLMHDEHGRWVLIASDKQEIEIRVTPSGLLRVGSVVNRRGVIRYDEQKGGES